MVVNLNMAFRCLAPALLGLSLAASATAEELSPVQIRQIEEIARTIAAEYNAGAGAINDEMTIASRASASGRNVRLEYTLRVKKGLSASQLKQFSDEMQREVVPKVCAENAQNAAFARGLSYTFSYANAYGERLAEFTVDRARCRRK